ncbi:MAG: hypothetical protein IH926_10370 [Proteobacteria bacterium]|nr:hypothetical protein [Pseudomonadota bacterium]
MVHQGLGNGPVNRWTTERRPDVTGVPGSPPGARPVEEGVSAIEAFAKTLGVGKDATLTLVFAGRIATIDAERSRIIAGIKRYAKRQRRLADRIRDLGAGLKGIPSDGPDEGDARHAELYRQWTRATRIFDERERSLKALCHRPVVLERRPFMLSRAIMAEMER